MTTLTAPAPQASIFSNNGETPIPLFQLGALFVIRASYWSCRAGNDAEEFNLSPAEVISRAIASFGTKELVDPVRGRKIFQQLEKQARHRLDKFSRPFAAANARFVPWEHVPALIDALQAIKTAFEKAVEAFLQGYPALRDAWQATHPDVPNAAYPSIEDLRRRFAFTWHTFKVAGAGDAMKIDDVEAELAKRKLRTEQLAAMKADLQAACEAFAAEYVLAFRKEVAEFCDQVIAAGGQVHGRTLQAIRRKIEHFHAMNVFHDADTAAQLNELKTQLFGLTGQTLKDEPALAAKLSQACALLKQDVLDPEAVSSLTGRLKRRVVLD